MAGLMKFMEEDSRDAIVEKLLSLIRKYPDAGVIHLGKLTLGRVPYIFVSAKDPHKLRDSDLGQCMVEHACPIELKFCHAGIKGHLIGAPIR